MKRFSSKLRCEVENKAVDAFLQDIVKVCEKHQMAIGHEDTGGAFVVHEFSPVLINWLFEARDATSGNTACKVVEP